MTTIDTSQTVDFTPAMRGTMQTTTDADGIRATLADAIAGVDNVKYMTAFQVKNSVVAINIVPATNVTVSPFGGISSTNAQSAFQELDTEKANLASPTFTGVPAAPTAAPGTNTTQLATTAFVTTADGLKANTASPTFTGTVTLPIVNVSGTATFNGSAVFNGTVTFANPQTFTNVRINPRTVTVVSAGAITPNSDTTDVSAVSALAVNLTINAPTGTPVDGQLLAIRIRDNGTSRTLSWNAAYSAISSELWAATQINKSMIWRFMWNASTSKWEVVSANPMPGSWGA